MSVSATTSSTTSAHISVLPVEIMYHIFGVLPGNILGQLATVCHQWRQVTLYEPIWQRVCQKRGWKVDEGMTWRDLACFQVKLETYFLRTERIRKFPVLAQHYVFSVRCEDWEYNAQGKCYAPCNLAIDENRLILTYHEIVAGSKDLKITAWNLNTGEPIGESVQIDEDLSFAKGWVKLLTTYSQSEIQSEICGDFTITKIGNRVWVFNKSEKLCSFDSCKMNAETKEGELVLFAQEKNEPKALVQMWSLGTGSYIRMTAQGDLREIQAKTTLINCYLPHIEQRGNILILAPRFTDGDKCSSSKIYVFFLEQPEKNFTSNLFGVIKCLALQGSTLAIKLENEHGAIHILDLNTHHMHHVRLSNLQEKSSQRQSIFFEQMIWHGYTLKLVRYMPSDRIVVQHWDFSPDSEVIAE